MTDPHEQTQDETVEAAGPEGPTAPAGEADVSAEERTEGEGESTEPDLASELADRTADLQRLQAEYVNYRKRVERDRAQARTQGETAVLRSLLTVLDDLGRAEQHGELTGGFKAVADSLNQTLKAHHLEAFGAPGDAFDPRLHEALFHAGAQPGIETTSVAEVVRVGYRVGDEVLRHAQVGVVDPAPEADAEQQNEE